MTPIEALRLLVGVPLVLVAPGWMWSLAFFPWWRRDAAAGHDGAAAAAGSRAEAMGLLDRAVVSLGLSIALVPLAALSWSAGLGLPLGAWGSLAVVTLVTGGGALAWRLRQRKDAARAPVN